jgi:hypothetical protein
LNQWIKKYTKRLKYSTSTHRLSEGLTYKQHQPILSGPELLPELTYTEDIIFRSVRMLGDI